MILKKPIDKEYLEQSFVDFKNEISDKKYLYNDVTFMESANRENIESGETVSTILGKIRKWFADLKTVAFTGKAKDITFNEMELYAWGGESAPGIYDGVINPKYDDNDTVSERFAKIKSALECTKEYLTKTGDASNVTSKTSGLGNESPPVVGIDSNDCLPRLNMSDAKLYYHLWNIKKTFNSAMDHIGRRLVPVYSATGETVKYLREDGVWAEPPGCDINGITPQAIGAASANHTHGSMKTITFATTEPATVAEGEIVMVYEE